MTLHGAIGLSEMESFHGVGVRSGLNKEIALTTLLHASSRDTR